VAVTVRGLEGSDVLRPGRPVADALTGPLELPEQPGDAVPAAPGAEASAELTRAALAGEAGRIVEAAVTLSAGVRLAVAGVAPTPLRGASAARAALADGSAAATLEAMIG
jgi:anthranilate phosphoribosyltransferase